MMPDCREVTRLIASEEYQGSWALRDVLVRLHLLMCSDCVRYAKEVAALGDQARDALREPLDPGRLEALERAILQRTSGAEDKSAERPNRPGPAP